MVDREHITDSRSYNTFTIKSCDMQREVEPDRPVTDWKLHVTLFYKQGDADKVMGISMRNARTHTHTRTHTRTHTHTYTLSSMCNARAHTHIHTHANSHTHTQMRMRLRLQEFEAVDVCHGSGGVFRHRWEYTGKCWTSFNQHRYAYSAPPNHRRKHTGKLYTLSCITTPLCISCTTQPPEKVCV